MEIIDDVLEIILERKKEAPEGSYVAQLMSGGQEKILVKIEEESAEVIQAARIETREELIHEIADLIFHVLVLMGHENITPEDISA
ncbi:MAG TPA: phosphoribosyl-ATP diphosphatase, partial [Euryarchaeota archaeon]|nr:phosphoribosyl-ATP diphosphatase [Euryarchaeota archaeon]